VLTLNLGLLALGLPLGQEIALSPFLRDRLAAAPEHVRAAGPDIVALQEVYTERQRRFLERALRDTHPHAGWPDDRRRLPGSGLMVLSRYPIARMRFERGAARMGCLAVSIEVPGFGTVGLVNAHLTVGGMLRRPGVTDSLARRIGEIDGILSVARQCQDAVVVLLGDFNCGPTVWRDCYKRILGAGYIDAFAAANPPATHGDPTWDARNPLNAEGPYRSAPSQRIDHVFLRSDVAPASGRIVFTEHSVATAGGRRVPLSDHYGVRVALAILPPAAARPR
jgi:endonuclease/exonuclease/phosphatase family metal-dependent hydrolase